MLTTKMVAWHHRLNGQEFEQTLGDSGGQGSLADCNLWGHNELDTTKQLNNNNMYSNIHCTKLHRAWPFYTTEWGLRSQSLPQVKDSFIGLFLSRPMDEFPKPGLCFRDAGLSRKKGNMPYVPRLSRQTAGSQEAGGASASLTSTLPAGTVFLMEVGAGILSSHHKPLSLA